MSLSDVWTDLAEPVLAPIKAWLAGQPLWLQALLLLAIPLVSVGWKKRRQLKPILHVASATARASFSLVRIPIRKRYSNFLATAASRIALQARVDLTHELDDSDDGAWAAAQLAVVLSQRAMLSEAERTKVAAFIMSQRCTDQAYWMQKDRPPHLAVSAWCLYALTSLNHSIDLDAIQYLTQRQNDDGSWPLYADIADQSGSVFATATIAIVLNSCQDVQNIGTNELVKVALARAEGWLIQYCDRTRTRWKYYPSLADSPESDSDSGLALYALTQLSTNRSSNEDLKVAWLQSLPRIWPKHAFDRETSGHWFGQGKTAIPDIVSHLKLPWLLVATAVSYDGVGLPSRIRALRAIEACIEQQDWGIGGFRSYQRAELLFAIGTLQKYLRSYA